MGSRSTPALLLAALAALALAAPPADAKVGEPLPGIDVRRGEQADVPAGVEQARERLDRRLGDAGRVATDQRTGGVRWLAATDSALTGASPGDAADAALAYVRRNLTALGLDEGDLDGLRPAARYRDVNGITHITWQQTSRGLVSYDTTLSVNLGPGNEVLNVTGGAVGDLSVPTVRPEVGASEALAIAKRAVDGELHAPRASRSSGPRRETSFANGDSGQLMIFAGPDEDRLAWRLEVAGPRPLQYEVLIDAASGELLARNLLTTFADEALVYDYHPGKDGIPPHTVNLNGPDGTWLNDSAGRTRLKGANAWVFANENADNFAEDIAAENNDWKFPQASVPCAASQTPSIFTNRCTWSGALPADGTQATNRKQGAAQLFYFINTFHDWLEAPPIGFTPASHNFEGNDPVLGHAQYGVTLAQPSVNNAGMLTPGDGNSPQMFMFLYQGSYPAVSSADDASVVYHEYTHGLSNRLVGNGAATALNSAKQSRAMGEGWSDFYAADFLVEKGFDADTATDGELVHADYTNNDQVGKGRVSALDCQVGSAVARCAGNASSGPGGFTFGDLGKILGYNGNNPDLPLFEEHADGEFWAQTLWDLRVEIGGTATRRLVTEAMRLSPTPPSMLDERDAILLADAATGGTHHDDIWAVFAERGMGVGASSSGPNATRASESFAVPTQVARASRPIVTDPAPLGDGDGAAEPGETVRVRVPVRNLTPSALAVGSARLSSSAPGVLVGTPTVDYGSIPGETTQTPVAAFTVTLPAATACGPSVPLSLRVTDAATLSLSLPVGARQPGTTYSAVAPDVPKPIGDFSFSNVPLTVPAGQPAIDALRVRIKLTHQNIGDLHARLAGPDGTRAQLIERVGATFGGSTGNDMDVVLDDAAAQSIQDRPLDPTTLGTTGDFRPNEPLSAFAGRPLSGMWTLRILDAQSNGIGGQLQEFSITPLQAACPTSAPALPEATSAAATSVTADGASVNGSVDPNGTATEFAFQYGKTAEYGSQTTPASVGAGADPAPVAAGLIGLDPSTLYHFRVVALRNGTVVAAGADLTFTTDGTTPPVAVSSAATAITDTGATLNGTVDAKGTPTDYAFQYGPTTAYGTQTTPASAGAAVGAVARSATLTTLAPGTEYHFRIVALRNGAVVAQGSDQSFTTSGAATPTPTPTVTATATVTATTTATPGVGATATATTPAVPTLGATPTVTASPPGKVPPSVVAVSKVIKLDGRRMGSYSFLAGPAGLAGDLSVRARKAGRKRAFPVGGAQFAVPAGGRVTVVVSASKKAYKALGRRKRKTAKADVTVRLGGTTFVLPVKVRR